MMVSRAVAASSLARFSMQAFAIGKDTLLQGEYRLLEMIGGTESRVYLAKREQRDGLAVARLWKPSAELLHAYGAQALFERALGQMRAATLLRHPVLAMVETCGVLDDGTLFMVSEQAEGTPLDTFVDRAGIPPLASVIDLAYRVCSALNAAHRNGLAHAALHPRSFIVRPHDEGGALARLQAKLIDFGAPTCMFPSPPSLHAARFMAPEQLELALKPPFDRGEPTVRMNVYGCGALLYYLCTGGPPLPGRSVEELLVAQAAHKVLPPSRINPQVIPALDAIILKALDPQPRARFANAAELANALISIRFERSSSGVRHRAVDGEHKPRDRRVTVRASDDVTHVVDASEGFDDPPTSKTTKPPPLPRGSHTPPEPAFPSERPTAQVHLRPELSAASLLPLTPLPPSLPPPMPEEEITAETLLPTKAQLDAEVLVTAPRPPSAPPERPAVLARPARKSIAPMHDFFGHVPPGAVIAVAAVISLSIIYAVITQPSASDATIEVTPLPPAAAPQKRAAPAPAPAPAPAEEAAAGAARVEPAITELAHVAKPSDPQQRDSRSRRSPRAVETPSVRVPPSADEASAHDPIVPKPQLAAPPEPEPEATPAPQVEEQAVPAEPARSAAPSAPAAPRSPITPLPEPARPAAPKPIAPLPDKANPRVSEVQVKGSLATSQVRRGIERIKGATESCYRAALAARPSTIGELDVEVVFDERGRARSARVAGAAPSSLQRCVESASLRIAVPPPDTGTVTATWKVSL
jgi:serine/threonine-protein kinase